MPNVPYPYEVNGKLVRGNGSLIPISSLTKRSLTKRSLLPSLTVLHKMQQVGATTKRLRDSSQNCCGK